VLPIACSFFYAVVDVLPGYCVAAAPTTALRNLQIKQNINPVYLKWSFYNFVGGGNHSLPLLHTNNGVE
jgi:hypothetical protein